MKGIRTFLPGIKTVSPASQNWKLHDFSRPSRLTWRLGPIIPRPVLSRLTSRRAACLRSRPRSLASIPVEEAFTHTLGEILLFASMGIDARYHALVDEGGDGSIVERAIGLAGDRAGRAESHSRP